MTIENLWGSIHVSCGLACFLTGGNLRHDVLERLICCPYLILLISADRNLTGTLPTELGALPELRFLFLYENPNLAGSLPSELGNATSLELFFAHECSLTGSIPAEMRELSSLEKLLSWRVPSVLGEYL